MLEPTQEPTISPAGPVAAFSPSHTKTENSHGTDLPALSHPAISNGWFSERSGQWPGQAFTLEVKRILHIEQSKYQDVLVFESCTYGNVLVLDGAIQCTERDEFSYQEMIAHIPLCSHPQPKAVLIIGGGDGGVLREVLKHPGVEHAVLCDIDEAVPRISKRYLPAMAVGLTDPRATIHIGDGFEFLQEQAGRFDVVITDSSDPEGPAASLFERPYFELLRGALKPGGTIATQGESFWLHLDLITSVLSSVRSVFPRVDYAYTTIPSYPGGSIGFVVASLDDKRDLTYPLRPVSPTSYYSPQVHRAAFVLPQFVRKTIVKGSLAEARGATLNRKVLLLGSGFVAQPAAEYILRRPENQLTIGCRTLAKAQELADDLSRKVTVVSIDVKDARALDALIASHDVIISLIPYTFHTIIIKSAIKHRKHVVTTSYVSAAMQALDAEAKQAGIIVLNEIGLDPGIDHLYAVKTIDDVHAEGGKITAFLSYCGGLPAPESADNPLGYKFSWSSRGVLLALLNSARLYRNGKLVEIPGSELMWEAKPYFIQPGFAFVAYPNRDSTAFREKYCIPEAETIIRGTLRYAGFPQFVRTLVDLGFLDQQPHEYIAEGLQGLKWSNITARAIGSKSSNETHLIERIDELVKWDSSAERLRILAGIKWIGLLSPDEGVHARGTLLDTLCATLEAKMQYQQGERDMVMLQHTFHIQRQDGSTEVRTSTLLDFGAPFHTGTGPSSMARLVGIPCGVAAQLILDGVLEKPGIHAPYTRDIVDPLMKQIEAEGISMVERTVG